MSFISGIPIIGNALDSMLNPDRGYKAAADEMQKMWQQSQAFQQPFMNAGTAQLPQLTSAENQLLNPSDLLAKWMQSYSMSPFAQTSMTNAKNAGLDAASSMGLMGSSPALKNIQQSSSDIMNADRQQFLNDLMQKFMTGIGVGQNIYGLGAQTAGNLGTQGIQVGENLGQAAFGQKNAPGDMLMKLLAIAGNAYGGSQLGKAATAAA